MMPDAMFLPVKCCFCVELRPGCFIIAYIQLSIEILTFGLLLYGIMEGSVMLTSTVKAITEMGFVMMMLSVVFLLFLGLMLLFTLVLIVGLHKKKRSYLRAYLLCAMVYLVVAATTGFISFPLVEIYAIDVTYKIVSLVLHVYFIFVIRSYWNKISRNNRTISS